MKNIVKVLRLKDNVTRLYEVPTCVVLDRGTVVEVEYGSDSTALGVTVSASYCGVSEERMVRDLFNVLPGTEFKRVVAVYDKQMLAWADSLAADTAEENAEQSATPEEVGAYGA